ncbi:hypothetical protein ABI59_21245 [Acidobacteria bacterium Mor1]|nr:hypothetical protein ABI59_21245 [Acidobacteria bacterium Mor1]
MPRLSHGRGALALLALILLLGAPSGAGEAPTDDTEVERFLRKGKIVSIEPIGTGVTRPKRVTLELDGVTLRAAFKNVDSRIDRAVLQDGTVQLAFTDSFHNERAAYLLARKLGIRMVPVTVVRSIGADRGALTIWVEDAITQKAFREKGVEPDESLAFQRDLMAVFDALIHNDDRNTGNQLITPDNRLHLIDHSRSFRNAGVLPEHFLTGRYRLTRELFESIEQLDGDEVKKLLRRHLNGKQIKALMARRDQVVTKLQVDLQNHGEEALFTDWTHLH